MNLLSFNKTNPNLSLIPFKENNAQAQKHKLVKKEERKRKKKRKKGYPDVKKEERKKKERRT